MPSTKRAASVTLRRIRRSSAVLLCAMLAMGMSLGATASAQPSAFYTPPAALPAERGAVVKTEPFSVTALPPGAAGEWPIAAQRVMFTSRTQDAAPVAVTGVFLDAAGPWTGPGERPTVIVAPGTIGQGDQCAPSVAFETGLYAALEPSPTLSANQEALSAAAWRALGARVFVTDYIGLGTPGIHTYVNRLESAHAVLDAARVANKLAGTGNDTPLLLWGYSQGGGATAAAAELQPTYAPELNVKGVWAGGPVADLEVVLDTVDGTLIGGVIGFTINGFVDRYPELNDVLDRIVTPHGRQTLAALSTACIADVILERPFLHTSTMTVDGRSLRDWVRETPEVGQIVQKQRVGALTPSAPVLITSGINDDTVPYSQALTLAHDWCANGADVTFRTNPLPAIATGWTLPNHFSPQIIDGYATENVIPFLLDQLTDTPATGCHID